jgi:hypothetical protein
MSCPDDLVHGAIDLHVHGYPEIADDVKTRHDDVELVRNACAAGMRGLVLKSHQWPTVGRAYHLRKTVPGFDVYSSITLNTTSGGFSPVSVESAARQGARVVFMPTWSAANDLRRGGFSSYMRSYLCSVSHMTPEEGLSVLDSTGRLRREVAEILQLAKQYRLVIATGHISPQESVVLADEVRREAVGPVIFSHPDSRSVGGTLEDAKRLASMGAFIEVCALGMMPAFQRVKPQEALAMVREIGASRCILTTDFFFEWAPPAAEMLRMTIGTFQALGLGDDDIRLMVKTNPEKILGL